MSLSSDLARENTGRLAGRKGPAKLQSVLVRWGRIAAWAYYPNTERSNQYMEPAPGNASPSPGGLKNNPSPSR